MKLSRRAGLACLLVLAGTSGAAAAADRSEVVVQALALVGAPYRYGGEDPVRGFDCSGLVRHVFRSSTGMDLPRRTEDLGRVGSAVARAALVPGDLVFFNTRGRPNSHVAIYIGDGRFVHAPAFKGEVRVETMNQRYWDSRYNGARRILATDLPVRPAEPAIVAPIEDPMRGS